MSNYNDYTQEESNANLNKYGKFVENKTNLQKANINKTLDKVYNFDELAVMSVAEFIHAHLKDGDLNPYTREWNKVNEVSRRTWNRMSASEQQAYERKVQLGGKKTMYFVNGYQMPKTAYDYALYLLNNNQKEQ